MLVDARSEELTIAQDIGKAEVLRHPVVVTPVPLGA
jgi:hypothetical protein